MPDLAVVHEIVGRLLPFDFLKPVFMRQALIGLILLSPITASLGVQVVNLRMAFFSDAISHSAFAGIALGLIAGVHPHVAMPLFGLLAGTGIMAFKRNSSLPSDTVIAVFFSGLVASGLAVVSREASIAGDIQQFLYGDILLLSESDIRWLLILFAALLAFQYTAYNRLLHIGVYAVAARAHGVPTAFCQYVFAAMLSLVVMFSVWGVGVLLVTAMLVVPAAAARNLARSAGGMFWWALLIGFSSAVSGLMLSAQEWMNTATGATIILVACAWFVLSAFVRGLTKMEKA
jgi:zinc transport system permease protein